jgi:ribonuclease P/MRP protein subunit RPP40
MLGPLLFMIYINDIDEVVSNRLLKFADDTKLFGVVATAQDIEGLQKDLDNLCSWSKDWLMLFNVNKCKIMHFGYNNHGINFEMNGQNLIEVKEERDLGIIMQHDLKWGNQCLKVAKTANRILGMIKRTFNCLSKEVVLPLYKSLVRPHLEFGIQAWRPYLRKDIDLLEGVQRRATKMIPSLKFKSYEDRLENLETNYFRDKKT